MKDHWRRGLLTNLGVALVTTILIGFAAPTVGAEEKDKECPYAGQKLTDEKLKPILDAHTAYTKDITKKTSRAVLCNADLGSAELQGADLQGASLQGADLQGASLQGANLSFAGLQGADLQGANLQGAKLVYASLQRADLQGASLQGADLGNAELQRANLSFAELQRANLNSADLEGADLQGANLQGADLQGANLQGAKLVYASLQGADLRGADLEGADLGSANLKNAILEAANLPGAKFQEADLRGANLQYSKLAGVTFLKANLSNTSFLGVDLMGLKIFETLAPNDFPEGLVSVREKFKQAGDREQERYLTFLIKRNERRDAPPIKSAFGYILFEVTSDWGFAPGRPLLILVVMIAGFSLFYMQAILVPEPEKYGIYRFWPDAKDRVKDHNVQKKPERIEVSDFSELRMLGWGLYFSVLSAFHIGWRDLNVGSWIVRIQSREYALRATGWVRVVSGVQSLISVYLLALWALVYFARPFE